MKEHDVQTQILEWLRLRGIVAWRVNTGAARLRGFHVRFGLPGQADIFCLRPDGIACFIECKSRTGKLSEAQERFRGMVTRSNAVYVVARSLDDVKGLFDT